MTVRSTPGAGVLRVAVLSVFALAPVTASAERIIFTYTGESGSGSIGGKSFSNRSFTITAIGDELNRRSIGGGGGSIDHDVASIAIDGVGNFTFVSPTRTFSNNGVTGFSRGPISGPDLYNGPRDSDSGQMTLLQWAPPERFPPVLTSGGQLIFNSAKTTGTVRTGVALFRRRRE
jgi:hypothetical protein